MTIIQSIRFHPETIAPPASSYIPPARSSMYKKPEKWNESKASRIYGSNVWPHDGEYKEAIANWANRCGGMIVGQKLMVKFHPNGPDHERIFTRILPIADSYVILGSQHKQKEVQIIEVWNPEHDVFTRVDPQMCAPISKD